MCRGHGAGEGMICLWNGKMCVAEGPVSGERQWDKWEIVMYLMLKVGNCLSIKSELDYSY